MRRLAWILIPIAFLLTDCAARSPAPGTRVVSRRVLESREGLASYYGPGFDGKLMASGGRFDMDAMVAAHPTYPFGTVVRITNLGNRRSVEVRILDRGPAAGPRREGVIIDVSQGAAKALGFVRAGRARVKIEVLNWGGSG